MHSVSVKVPSSKGYQMAGTIDFPDAPPAAFALFAHCFTGSRFTPAAARVSKTLADLGIACLRFDFPGLGQSEGNFAETCFSENVEDIRAAAQWLKDNYTAPQLLIGHSLGGAASLKAATDMPSIKAVATIGAPLTPPMQFCTSPTGLAKSTKLEQLPYCSADVTSLFHENSSKTLQKLIPRPIFPDCVNPY